MSYRLADDEREDVQDMWYFRILYRTNTVDEFYELVRGFLKSVTSKKEALKVVDNSLENSGMGPIPEVHMPIAREACKKLRREIESGKIKLSGDGELRASESQSELEGSCRRDLRINRIQGL